MPWARIDRFSSLARPHRGKKGTGLGLTFVEEIAELHGGSASLDNDPRGGGSNVATAARFGGVRLHRDFTQTPQPSYSLLTTGSGCLPRRLRRGRTA